MSTPHSTQIARLGCSLAIFASAGLALTGCTRADQLRAPNFGATHSAFESGNLSKLDAVEVIDHIQAELEGEGFATERVSPLELVASARTRVVRGVWVEPTRTETYQKGRRVVNIDRAFVPAEPSSEAWATETATIRATARRDGTLGRIEHTLTVEPVDLTGLPVADAPKGDVPGSRFYRVYSATIYELHSAPEPTTD